MWNHVLHVWKNYLLLLLLESNKRLKCWVLLCFLFYADYFHVNWNQRQNLFARGFREFSILFMVICLSFNFMNRCSHLFVPHRKKEIRLEHLLAVSMPRKKPNRSTVELTNDSRCTVNFITPTFSNSWFFIIFFTSQSIADFNLFANVFYLIAYNRFAMRLLPSKSIKLIAYNKTLLSH